ncbi:MAG: LptF/LptG family permease [Vicinamibacterales bacterium]
MIRTLDRYVLREVLVPMGIALAVLTFLLEVPVIMRYGEDLVARGAPWPVILQVLATLIPQALSVTIPMSVLLGILVGFGRLSADREFVAMQACGVSLLRLARPVALVALLATAATAHQTIVALPNANQTFREVVFGFMAEQVENTVRPRVFFDEFTHRVIYVRDVPPEGGWRDVFFADAQAGTVTVYFAQEGRILIDREKRIVQLQLIDGTSHSAAIAKPEELRSSAFDLVSISLDPNTVFPPPPARGAPEMTFAELNENIAAEQAQGRSAAAFLFMYHQKLSLPATCIILALIALALGASSRRDGRLASVAVGIGVIFAYYILLWGFRALALGDQFSAAWAAWVPNIILGIVAVVLMAWRSRSADQPIRLTLPTFRRRKTTSAPGVEGSAGAAGSTAANSRVVVVIRLPHLNLPRFRLLDGYVAREYVRVFLLGLVGLLGVFYIATFIDLADKLFRGEATTGMMLRYFYFQTPQFFYYVMPMAVLVATLVTVGILTKNSEIIVMRACGISLYRTMAPLLVFALTGSATLFAVGERVLAPANLEADRLNRLIQGLPPRASALNRQWIAGSDGEMYRFDYFSAEDTSLTRLWVYRLDEDAWDVRAMTYAERAVPVSQPTTEDGRIPWRAQQGWIREFTPRLRSDEASDHQPIAYERFDEHIVELDSPRYFATDAPTADMMTYGELRDHIEQLQSSGAYAARHMVALQRKVAFPFVTLIMTMLAVPFAVTTGRRGALYGIGIGIVLAITYIIALSLFAALGDGGMLNPTLAAWAPNILFGAAAAYMVLTVRT